MRQIQTFVPATSVHVEQTKILIKMSFRVCRVCPKTENDVELTSIFAGLGEKAEVFMLLANLDVSISNVLQFFDIDHDMFSSSDFARRKQDWCTDLWEMLEMCDALLRA